MTKMYQIASQMNHPPRPTGVLQHLGYSQREAEFLYLVATHSGYFTTSQFLRFIRGTKGGVVHTFTEKILRHRHGRAVEYGRKTHVFNLFSRRIYDAIDKDNLCNSSKPSNALIHIRLLSLDFVLDHPDCQYLETERDKVDYFNRHLAIPLSALPARLYKSVKACTNATRYFVDRLPILLGQANESVPEPGVPTFVYCDPAEKGLLGFSTYLRNYEALLRSLPGFNLIFGSARTEKVDRAARIFHSMFGQDEHSSLDSLRRYFQIRKRWESHETGELDCADRDCLRAGDQRFRTKTLESAYGHWAGGALSEADLANLFVTYQDRRQAFSACRLPQSYPIFYSDTSSP